MMINKVHVNFHDTFVKAELCYFLFKVTLDTCKSINNVFFSILSPQCSVFLYVRPKFDYAPESKFFCPTS